MVHTHALIHVLCCAVLCCAVLCCAVLCCAVLCCAVLCCAVLCLSVDHVMFNGSSPSEWTLVAAQGYIMQMLAAKLGVATGKHLAEHCRQAPPPFIFGLHLDCDTLARHEYSRCVPLWRSSCRVLRMRY